MSDQSGQGFGLRDSRAGLARYWRLALGVLGCSLILSAPLIGVPGTAAGAAPSPAHVPPTPPSPPSTPPLPTAEPNVYTVPSTINSSCSKKVTQALRSWIMGYSGEDATLEFGGGCFLVGSLDLSGLNDVVLDGQGATIEDARTSNEPPNVNAPMMLFGDVQNETTDNDVVENFNFVSTNVNSVTATTSTEAEAGIGIQAVGAREGFAVIDNTFTNTWADAINLEPQRNPENLGQMTGVPQNVTILGNTIDGTGRQGITLASCQDVLIEQNSFTDVNMDSIDVEADQSNEGCTNLVVEDNTANAGNGDFFANDGASSGAYTGNIFVLDNVMTQFNSGVPIQIEGQEGGTYRNTYVITGNTLVAGEATVPGMEFLGLANVYIEDNSECFNPANQLSAGFSASWSQNFFVEANAFYNADRVGSFGSDMVPTFQKAGNTLEDGSIACGPYS